MIKSWLTQRCVNRSLRLMKMIKSNEERVRYAFLNAPTWETDVESRSKRKQLHGTRLIQDSNWNASRSRDHRDISTLPEYLRVIEHLTSVSSLTPWPIPQVGLKSPIECFAPVSTNNPARSARRVRSARLSQISDRCADLKSDNSYLVRVQRISLAIN